MNTSEFRDRIRQLCRSANIYDDGRKPTIQDLADAIGISRTALSQKLNDVGRTQNGSREQRKVGGLRLESGDARAIIRTLVEWGAISTRAVASELLQMANCPSFTAAEWQSSPFDRLSNTLATSTNLPAQVTSLIGREYAVEEVCNLLRQPDTRLVTLTGIGGSGKTRLAIAVAADLARTFADGSLFVPLAAISNSAYVASVIAQTLGLKSNNGEYLASIVSYLQAKNILLVLDNFEQVIDAAPIVAKLLSAAPNIKIIVTSRERLHLYGEHEFMVQPLSVPSTYMAVEDALKYPAVDLFIQRAKANLPTFRIRPSNIAAIIDICTKLNGLPLAIELAVAHIRLYTPQEISKRLDAKFDFLTAKERDRNPRQQSLRHTLAWSYSLLTADEQLVLRKLGVFIGGCTPEAVAAVCTMTNEEVLSHLTALADKSLLSIEKVHCQTEVVTRIKLLELVREYAREELCKHGEAPETSHLHARYYNHLAASADKGIVGPKEQYWLDKLELEHDNIKAALTWSEQHSPKLLAGIAANIGLFWILRSYLSEGNSWLQKALLATSAPSETRLLALRRLGQIARAQGNYTLARNCFAEILSLSCPDDLYTAHALRDMATVISDANASIEMLAKAMEVYKRFNDYVGEASVYTVMANIAVDQCQLDAAEEYHLKALATHKELGRTSYIAQGTANLASVYMATGNYKQAIAMFEETLVTAKAILSRLSVLQAFSGLGVAYMRLKQYGLAVKYHLAHYQLAVEVGDNLRQSYALEFCGYTSAAIGELAAAAVLLGAALAARNKVSDELSVGERADYFAEVTDYIAFDEQAVALAWVLKHYTPCTSNPAPISIEAWRKNWQVGEAMSVKDVITYLNDWVNDKPLLRCDYRSDEQHENKYDVHSIYSADKVED